MLITGRYDARIKKNAYLCNVLIKKHTRERWHKFVIITTYLPHLGDRGIIS